MSETPFQMLRQAGRAVLNRVAPLPRHVQVEITNICNLNCLMCFRHVLDFPIRHMDMVVFRAILEKLAGVHTVTVSGYGEPFCHPQIMEALRLTKTGGFYTRTTSNGLLLDSDEKINALLDTGLDYIAFSLESLTDANEVGHPGAARSTANIRRLVEIRRSRGLSKPMVTLQTIMFKHREQDVLDIIHWGEEVGADRVNVARFEVNTLSKVQRPTEAEEQALFREFARLRRHYAIQIDCLQDQVYSGFSGWLYKYGKPLLRMDSHCIRMKDFLYIGVDGMARPCCALVKVKLANLIETDLKSIWHGKRMQRFRENYRKVPWCRSCDFARIHQLPQKVPGNDHSGKSV